MDIFNPEISAYVAEKIMVVLPSQKVSSLRVWSHYSLCKVKRYIILRHLCDHSFVLLNIKNSHDLSSFRLCYPITTHDRNKSF